MEYADWINEVKHSRLANEESLKEITAGWDGQEATDAPKTPKSLSEMTKEERALFKSVYWAHLNGRGQEERSIENVWGTKTGRMANTNPDLSVIPGKPYMRRRFIGISEVSEAPMDTEFLMRFTGGA